ncbi:MULTISPECIES: nuclear transport factor 2 family protein [Arthrobacter]|uniref:nuclear transport factor 2 family protein n=1 Tax=Arthrobacter TaxID=1663 RepID=UPI0008324592|nr:MULTISPECIES: nuclear transport factor 2 family protein [Arthrobacter]UPO76409.1 nuclear transport factor 2 family protein [Arthrobacter sp. Helios]
MSRNKDVIDAHYAASDRGDLAGMVADFAPDIRWTEAAGFPLAGTFTGPDAVIEQVFKKLPETWADWSVSIDEVLDAGNTVIGVGTYSGVNRVTGRDFTARVAHLWRLDAGKVVAFEQIPDSAVVREAM